MSKDHRRELPARRVDRDDALMQLIAALKAAEVWRVIRREDVPELSRIAVVEPVV